LTNVIASATINPNYRPTPTPLILPTKPPFTDTVQSQLIHGAIVSPYYTLYHPKDTQNAISAPPIGCKIITSKVNGVVVSINNGSIKIMEDY
jgi:hypothetical protein